MKESVKMLKAGAIFIHRGEWYLRLENENTRCNAVSLYDGKLYRLPLTQIVDLTDKRFGHD